MTTDTAEINGLLAALPPEGGVVELDKGRVYDIDPALNATGGIRLTGVNKTLRLNGATLRAVPNAFDAYAIIRMGVGAQDPSEFRMHRRLRVVGPGVIEGDRYGHLATTGEQGMGIWFTNCEDAYAHTDIEIRHCWGDGVYFDKHDVTQGSLADPASRPLKAGVEGCWIHHNRRNNVSLVGAVYIDLVGNMIEDADGTGPYAAIDIEPDAPGIGVDTVRILRNTLRRNKGPGLEIVNVIGGSVKDVIAEQNIITANGVINGFGVKVVDMEGGWLSLLSNTITNNYGDGIYVEARNYTIPAVDIAHNRIRGQVASTIAFGGGTYCGHGIRFKNMPPANVAMTGNRLAGNGLGDVLWA